MWTKISFGYRRRPFVTAVLLVGLAQCAITHTELAEKRIKEACVHKCSQGDYSDDLNTVCDKDCQSTCADGCRLWRLQMSGNCSKLCENAASVHHNNGDDSSTAEQCLNGCETAVALVMQEVAGNRSLQISVEFHLTPRPSSVAFQVTKDDPRLPTIFCRVQFRYMDGDWQYYTQQEIFEVVDQQASFEISGFKPYTKYQFRLAWSISESLESLYTEPTVMSTQAYGPPQGAPQKVTCLLSSYNQVAVSWRPPSFPAGPEVSYLLEARETRGGTPFVHELLAKNATSDHVFSYLFRELTPNTEYTVSVQAANRNGRGKLASCQVNTTNLDEASADQRWGFATSDGDLYKFDLSERNLGFGHLLFSVPGNGSVIRGLAGNLQSRVLYASDNDGRIHVVKMDRNSLNLVPQTLPLNVRQPSLLWYDWLNRRLFVLDESSWEIKSCTIEQRFTCTAVVEGFSPSTAPEKIVVDSYNGYMFWMARGVKENQDSEDLMVLYRVDLIVAEENTTIHWSKAEVVHQSKGMKTFAVDYVEFRLYIVDLSTDSIYALNMDSGNIVSKVREQWAFYSNSSDIVFANEHVHLATTDGFFIEDGRPPQVAFSYRKCNNFTAFRFAFIDHKTVQPAPSPATPPENVRALFGSTFAEVFWDAPSPLTWQGRGAFRRFLYTVDVTEIASGQQVAHIENIERRQVTITWLSNATKYRIMVRAHSELKDTGPPSTAFVGLTLKSDIEPLVWSTVMASINGGLKRYVFNSDATGDNAMILASAGLYDDINAIAWLDDMLFLGRNRTNLIRVDLGNGSTTELPEVTGVTCLGIDTYARKIYWGSLTKRAILRCNVDGSFIELVALNIAPHSLAVDSARGLIVWADQFGVYTANLSGKGYRALYETHISRGYVVQGLAYDSTRGMVMSSSRSIDGLELRMDNLDKNGARPAPVNLSDSSLRGPLMYLEDRLIWLDRRSQPVITLLDGTFPATMRYRPALIHAKPATSATGEDGFNDAELNDRDFPETLAVATRVRSTTIMVVPKDIKNGDIKVEGTHDDFTIRWPQEQSVHVAVSYRIRVTPCSHNESEPCCPDNADSHLSVVTSKVKALNLKTNRYIYPDKLRPHTRLAVQLQPYTDWANAKTVCQVLRSPESTPTAPQMPKVFVAHHSVFPRCKEGGISYPEAEFRWSGPDQPNGMVLGYVLNAWYRRNAPHFQVSNNVESAADNRIDATNQQYGGEDTVIVWRNLKVFGHSFNIPKLVPNSTYFFKVSAFTSAGEGPASMVLSINSDDEMPVPRLLVVDQQEATPEADSPGGPNSLGKGLKHSSVQVSDVDNGNVTVVSNKVTNPIGVAFLDDTVFWLEQRGPIMSSAMDGSNISVVYSPLTPGTSLTVDWVGRRLYWVEYDGTKSTISALDLADGRRVNNVLELPKKHISSLAADPFSSSLVYTVSSRPLEAASIMLVSIDGCNPRMLFPPRWRRSSPQAHHHSNGTLVNGNANNCTCSLIRPLTRSVVALDAQSKKGPGTIYFADADQGNIWSTDLVGCHCDLVANATLTKGLPPDVMTVDLQRIYWSQRGREEVFSILKESAGRHAGQGASGDHVAAVKVANGVRNIRALNSQHYPDPTCMEIGAPATAPALVVRKPNSLQVEVFPPEIAEECSKISRATVRYVVKYKKGNCLGEACRPTEVTSSSATPVLLGLDSYTTYVVSYYYVDPYTQNLHGPSPPSSFVTDDAEPGPAQSLSAVSLTPDTLEIRWRATSPSRTRKEPRYELRCFELSQAKQQSHASAKHEQKLPWDIKDPTANGMNLKNHNHKEIGGNETLPMRLRYDKLAGGEYSAIMSDLQPNTVYMVEVVAVNRDKPGMRSAGSFVSNRTFNVPSDLVAGRVERRQIELKWRSSKKAEEKVGQESFTLEYSLDGQEWQPLAENRSSTSTKPDYEHSFKVSGLVPYTEYWFRLRITYRSEYDRRMNFTWPPPKAVADGTARGFSVRTLEDRPDPPGQPTFSGPESNLVWEPRASNSGGELTYELQARLLDANTTTDWFPVYTGVLNQFDARDLSSEHRYDFRVRASNPIGNSDWVQTEKPLAIPAIMVVENVSSKSVLGVVLPSLILLIVGALLAVERFRRRRSSLQKQPHGPCPPVELATLRGLPCTSNFVHQHNELYTFCDVPLTDAELSSIPTIDREQIRLNQLLGSGAFGDVFEGVLYGDTAQKIAVKMLRKGANEIEKAEFLKEAKLMSNFRHPHILTLLGISFDFNMSFIIMELMEDGDLLSVLRSCRNSSVGDTEPSVGLTLEDLMGMCVDISKGCKYLEEMRFVHRDLAARNCLVASETLEDGRTKRLVKIGDFGLARDVYKSDYYRKEGEGLLPVRWMAPEALLDGVFTNCTDVWAFGVLTWEVLSLGQQPYPAMGNVDVFNYVRAGGVLACPPGCPLELYDLMCRCWSYTPEDRPKFYHLLAELEKLQSRVQTLTLPTAGTLGGSSGLFHSGSAPPTQYNYIIPPTTAAAEHYQQYQQQHEYRQQQPHYNVRHRMPADAYRGLTSVPLLSLGSVHHSTGMGVDNLAYEPSSASSLISSSRFGQPPTDAPSIATTNPGSLRSVGHEDSLETALASLAAPSSLRASLASLGGSLYSLRPSSMTGWSHCYSLGRSVNSLDQPCAHLSDPSLNSTMAAASARKARASADSLRGLTGSLEIEGSSETDPEPLPSEAASASNDGGQEVVHDILLIDTVGLAKEVESDILQKSANGQAMDRNYGLEIIQRVFEDETEGSTCSDLSAITTEDEQDNGVAPLRRDKPRPHSMELLGSSPSGSYDHLSGSSSQQNRNTKTTTLPRASFAGVLDNETLSQLGSSGEGDQLISHHLNERAAAASRGYLTILPPSTSDGSTIDAGSAPPVSATSMTKPPQPQPGRRHPLQQASVPAAELANNRAYGNGGSIPNSNKNSNNNNSSSSSSHNIINNNNNAGNIVNKKNNVNDNEKWNSESGNGNQSGALTADYQVPIPCDPMDHPMLVVGGSASQRSRPNKSATLGHMTGLNNCQSLYSQYRHPKSVAATNSKTSDDGGAAAGGGHPIDRRGCPIPQTAHSNGLSQQKFVRPDFNNSAQSCPTAGLIMTSAGSAISSGCGSGLSACRWKMGTALVPQAPSSVPLHSSIGITAVHNQTYNHAHQPAQQQQQRHNNNKSNNNPGRFGNNVGAVSSGEVAMPRSGVVMPSAHTVTSTNGGKPNQVGCQFRQFVLPSGANEITAPPSQLPTQKLHKVTYAGVHQGGDSNNNNSSSRTASWC